MTELCFRSGKRSICSGFLSSKVKLQILAGERGWFFLNFYIWKTERPKMIDCGKNQMNIFIIKLNLELLHLLKKPCNTSKWSGETAS